MKRLHLISKMLLMLFMAVSFHQCMDNEDLFAGFNTELEFQNLQEIHDSMTGTDTVQLMIADPTIENILEGPKGIRLVFPPNSTTLSGGAAVTAPLNVSLIEIFKRGDMIKHNIQTFANQDPLVSGGMFWLRVTDATGAQIALNGVQAILPYQTDATGYENSMQYFTGTTQSAPSGPVISWGLGNSEVSFDSAAGTNGEFTIWNIMGGWSNCDAFYELIDGESTQFSVRVPNASDFSNTKVFFTMNNFTAVAALTTVQADALVTYTASIPTGAQGKIIAISLVEGALHFATQDVTITGDNVFDITVEPGTVSDLQNLLNSIN